jgi:hypothetical protein
MTRSLFTALAALALLPASAPAQETYRIVLKQPGKDEHALYRRVERVRIEVEAGDGKDKDKQHREEKGLDLAFREQVLQPPSGPGDKGNLRRHYSRAQRIQNGQQRTLRYEGRTLLIEPKGKGGRYTFRTWVDGADMNGSEELDEEFNGKMPQLPSLGNAWLLPREAVRVGESWKIDPAPFLKILAKPSELTIHADRATGVGKLVRAYRKDGRQYGVLDLRIEVSPKSISADKVTVKLKSGKWTFRLLLDGCIDGSSTAYRLKGGMEATLKGTLAEEGMREEVRLRLRSDVFESRQEAGKE